MIKAKLNKDWSVTVDKVSEEDKAALVAPTLTINSALLEKNEVIGKQYHEYLNAVVNNSVSIALEKMYKPEYLTPNFMGLNITEDLSQRALMAVIQQLSMMRDYEKMFDIN